MPERLHQFFSTNFMAPHGYCLLWLPELIWLHVLANAMIAIAYFSIPVGLRYFARKRPDMPFRRIFILFASFIGLCGMTHVFDILVLWWPAYGLQGLLLLTTGLISGATAIFLWRILPLALTLPSPSKLQEINNQLNASYEEIEEKVRQRTAELEQMNAALASARQRADEASAAKTDFLANMSHEIRTPMNAVVGLSELLSRTAPLTDKQKQFIITMQSSAGTLLELINDLLDIEKIEAQSVELAHEPFNLYTTINEVVQVMGVRAREKQLSFVLRNHCPGLEDRRFLGDSLRVRQIVMNLCSNAVKFTDKGGVSVHLDCRDGTVSIVVEDTGIGIPEEKREHVFDQFVQADSSISRKYGGSGLGLAIVRRLVNMMNGSVKLESKLGEGSRFTVTLPLEDAAPVAAPAPHPNPIYQQPKPAPRPEIPEFGVRVLLVEDYLPNITVATAFLEQLGMRFDVAKNGREAIARFSDAPYDIVLLDLQMPGMTGFEVARFIRTYEADRPGHRAQIIAVTANVLKDEREQCIAIGMDDFLAKPYSYDQLQAVIARAAERRQ